MSDHAVLLLRVDERCRRRYAELVRAAWCPGYGAFVRCELLYLQALELWRTLRARGL